VAHGSMDHPCMGVVEIKMESLDFMRLKGYFQSNLDRPSKIQLSELLLPYSAGENRGGGRVVPWLVVRELKLTLWCINPRSDSSYAT
jgi:hypothetical protein